MAKSKSVKKVSRTSTKTGVRSPVVWILGIGAALLIVVVILTLKKRSNDAPKPLQGGKKSDTDNNKDNAPMLEVTPPMLEVQETPGMQAYHKAMKWANSFFMKST